MKKVIEIKGMSCAHCQAKAEKVLNAIPGVTAEVEDKTFRDVLNEAGFEVTSITEKKGLFG